MLNRCQLKLFLVLVTILSVLLFSTVGLAGDWVPRSIRIGTGGTFSSVYQIGAPISVVLTETLNMPVSAQETGGSAENCRLVGNKQVEMAVVVSPSDYYAYNGLPPFSEPIKSLRSGLVVNANTAQIIVLADSDIHSIPDLKGRKFCIGAAGSGQDTMARAILAEFGMSYDDITPVFIAEQVADLMLTGDVDAFMSIITIPGPWITELAQSRKLRILPLPDEVIDNLTEKYIFFRKAIIPAGIYRGVEEDVLGIEAVSSVIVHEDLDDTLVYNIVKGILDNKDRVDESYYGAKRYLTLEGALDGLSIPMHPGAIKYFEEINHPGLQDAPK